MKNLFLKAKLFLTTLWQSLQQKLGSLKIPFIQKPVSLRTILISLLVFSAVLLLIGIKSCSKTPPVKVIPVTTALPLAQEIRSFATFDGLVDPFLTVNLEARVKGYLTKIGFADGAMVKKGDLLFVIEQDTYIQDMKVKQAIFDEAKSEYARQKSLLNENATSQAAVDKALSSLQQAEANLALSKINYGYTEVRAPFDGLMGRHLLDVGTYLDATTKAVQLATIQQISPIYVYFSINERDFLKFEQGRNQNSKPSKSEINRLPVFVGLQNEIDYPHEGVLDYAANLISTETGALQLRAIFKNKAYQMIPGLYARVMVQYGPPRQALLIPLTAVMTDQVGSYVFVLDEKKRAQRQDIILGQRFTKYVEVSKGLAANSQLVINGFINLSINQLADPKEITLEAMADR